MKSDFRRSVVTLLGTLMAVGVGVLVGLLLAIVLIMRLWGRAG